LVAIKIEALIPYSQAFENIDKLINGLQSYSIFL
jgi:hypothetical protein